MQRTQHLLPERRLGRQAGDGGDHPAVTQHALVQVTSAEAVHKQAGVLTYLLEEKDADVSNGSSDHTGSCVAPVAMTTQPLDGPFKKTLTVDERQQRLTRPVSSYC